MPSTVNPDELYLAPATTRFANGVKEQFRRVQDDIDAAPWSMIVACSDETSDLTTGVKATVRLPYAVTLSEVRTSLTTASSSGLVDVDVEEGGVSIFSTRPTIDVSELTSVTATTPAVISDASIANNGELKFEIVGAGTGAKGLKVTLIGVYA